MPWDPMRGERLAPAWTAALALLDDGEWHPWAEVADTMVESSDLLPKTCAGLLHAAVRNQVLDRAGIYDQRTKTDHRVLRKAAQ